MSGAEGFETRIRELEDFIEDEFAKCTLDSVSSIEDGISLVFLIKGEDDYQDDIRESWQVTAHGVCEHALILGRVLPVFIPHHPRLRGWQDGWVELMYAEAPADMKAFERGLRDIHDEAEYGLFHHIYTPFNLSFGVGQLAKGPLSLLERYRKVLELHGMRPSFFGSRKRPQTEPPTLTLKLDWSSDWFVESFVIAQQYKAVKMS